MVLVILQETINQYIVYCFKLQKCDTYGWFHLYTSTVSFLQWNDFQYIEMNQNFEKKKCDAISGTSQYISKNRHVPGSPPKLLHFQYIQCNNFGGLPGIKSIFYKKIHKFLVEAKKFARITPCFCPVSVGVIFAIFWPPPIFKYFLIKNGLQSPEMWVQTTLSPQFVVIKAGAIYLGSLLRPH